MSYFTFDHKISVAPLGWGGIEIHILDSGGHCMGQNGMPFVNVIPQEFLLPSYVFELQKFSGGSRRGGICWE